MRWQHFRQWAEEARARLIPETLGLEWAPFYWLGFLFFLFIPIVFGWIEWRGIVLTLATLPPFLWLYFRAYRSRGTGLLLPIIGVSLLAYLLFPFNAFANTYLTYVAAFCALFASLPIAFGVFAISLGLFALEAWWLGISMFAVMIAAVVGMAVCAGNHQWLLKHRKDAELRLSHDEIRRLAQVAERERIGRDLHDLLGHTLSLIALKSELARKLIERDPSAARDEIVEVERVARDALAQVRRAVTGIRAASLKPELASARLLLEGAGVDFQYSLADLPLSPAQETCLALVLREAVTNVHRHAQANRVEASLRRDDDSAILTIIDDGRGGAGEAGNGLRGMEERLRALGGELRIVSPKAQGTRVVATLPMPASGLDHGGKVTPLRRSAA